VRADEERRRIGRRRRVNAAEIARGIYPYIHARARHPRREVGMNGAHRRREEGPGRKARFLGVAGEGAAAPDDVARSIK
jgi:hypothetical protein